MKTKRVLGNIQKVDGTPAEGIIWFLPMNLVIDGDLSQVVDVVPVSTTILSNGDFEINLVVPSVYMCTLPSQKQFQITILDDRNSWVSFDSLISYLQNS
jgi:hypothetical protein